MARRRRTAPSTEDEPSEAPEVVPTEDQAEEEAAEETTVSRPPGGYRVTRDGPVHCGGWVQTERGWALKPVE